MQETYMSTCRTILLMIHLSSLPHFGFGALTMWSVGAVLSTVVMVGMIVIDPNSLVTFGTAGMLFATPVAVIINTVMARRDATKAAQKVEQVAQQATEAAKLAAKVASSTGDKLDQIHTLVNSNLTASMKGELDALRELQQFKKDDVILQRKINELQAQLTERG